METMKLYRGRLIDHVQLVVRDLAKSKRFYGAVFEVLGIPIGGEEKDFFWADELCISTADSKTAIGAGGTDNGKAGQRPYHPGYYAAFVLDPDGNNIEVVHHGDAKRSAESIEIVF